MLLFQVQNRAKNRKIQNFEKTDCGINDLPPKKKLYIKFHKNQSITLPYIAILVHTENRHEFFVLQFLTPGGLRRTQKKNSARLEKRNH